MGAMGGMQGAGMGMMAMGVIIDASAQLQQGRIAHAEGKTQRNIMNYNAQVKLQNAKTIKQVSLFNQTRQAEAAERALSTTEARAGMTGALPPVEVFTKQKEESELENMLIGYESLVKRQQLETAAQFDVGIGRMYEKAGGMALKASRWQATSTILQGIGGILAQQGSGARGTKMDTEKSYDFGGSGSPVTNENVGWNYTRNFGKSYW